MSATSSSRIGAVAYFIWALLHFQASYSVYVLANGLPSGMERGRVFQDAFCLLCFAISTAVVAATLNWHNSRLGFWINLAVVAVADVGFILFVLIPGYVGLWPGILGPVFWGLGWLFTGLARAEVPKSIAAKAA